MKQTNNAIKFLMAQYRAIFKNAYLKGMASAVLLTAGLAAAGSTQAAAIQDTTQWAAETSDAYVVDSGDTIDINSTGDLSFSAGLTLETVDTAESGEGTNRLNAVSDTLNLVSQGDLNLESGRRLTIGLGAAGGSSGGNTNVTFANANVDANATLDVYANTLGSGSSGDSVLAINDTLTTAGAVNIVGSDKGSATLKATTFYAESGSVITLSTSTDQKTATLDGEQLTIGAGATLNMQGSGGNAMLAGTNTSIAADGVMLTDSGDKNFITSDNFTVEAGAFKVISGAADVTETFEGHKGVINGNVLIGSNSVSGSWIINSIHDEGTKLEGATEKAEDPSTFVYNSGSDDVVGDVTFAAGSNVQLGSSGAITVKRGSLTIEDGAGVHALASGATITVGASGGGTGDEKPALVISSTALADYLGSGDVYHAITTDASGNYIVSEVESKDAEGILVLTSGGRLELQDQADLSDFSYASGSATPVAGSINVSGSGVIYGDTLTVSKPLTTKDGSALTLATGESLHVSTNNLTLGDGTANGLNQLNNAGFTKITVRDSLTLNVADNVNDGYFLLNKSGEGAIQFLNSDAENTSTVSGNLDFSSTIRVPIKGNWEFNGNWRFSPGGNQYGIFVGGLNSTYDTYVTLKGELINSIANGGYTILYAKSYKTVDGTEVGNGYYSVLDLTQARLSSAAPSLNGLMTLSADINGEIKLTGAQLEDILTANNTQGFAIGVANNGVISVNSSITGEHAFTKFQPKPSAADGYLYENKVSFDKGGTLSINGDLSLYTGKDANGQSLNTADSLNIGTGTIQADTITLTNYAVKSDKDSTPLDTTVASGTLEVSEGLVVRRSDRLILGAEGSGAHVVLNSEDYSLGGAISVNNIDINAGSSLQAKTGAWATDADIYASGTNAFEVGYAYATADEADQAFIDAAKEQGLLVAQFTGDNFQSTTTGTVMNVHEQSKATFNTMQLADGSIVDLSGHLLVNGLTVTKAQDADKSDTNPAYVNLDNKTYGTSLTAGIAFGSSTINVNGAGAVMEFGNVATNALVDLDGDATDANNDGSKIAITAGGIDNATFNVDNFGQLKFNFDEGTALSTADIDALLKGFAMTDTTSNGYLNLGNADLGLAFETREDGKTQISWDNLAAYVNVIGSKATSDKLMSALVYGISPDAQVKGHYGALSVNVSATGITHLGVNGPMTLHNAADFGNYFVVNANTGKELGVKLGNGASLGLVNGGIIGSIVGNGSYDNSDSNNSVVIYNDSGVDAVTSILGKDGIAVEEVDTFEVKSITEATGSIEVNNLELDSSLTTLGETDTVHVNGGYVNSNGVLTTSALEVGKANNVAVNASNEFAVLGGLNTSKITLNNAQLTVLDGSVSTHDLTLVDGGMLQVGYEPDSFTTVDDPLSIGDESKPYSGEFEATGTTTLDSGNIFVDPVYGHNTSLVSLNDLHGAAADSDQTLQAGTLDGNVFVGQNAALGIGSADLATLKAKIERFQTNGSLNGEEIGSILYVGKAFTLGANQGITLTAQSHEDFLTYFNENDGVTNKVFSEFGVDKDGHHIDGTGMPVLDNTLFLGANTAILVDAGVTENADTKRTTPTAIISFAGFTGTEGKGSVIADGGEILVDGNVRASTYQVFGNATISYLDGTAYAEVEDSTAAHYEDNINVSTENDFLQGVVQADGTVTLGVNPNGRAIMHGASDPVYATLVAYAQGYNGSKPTEEEVTNHPVDTATEGSEYTQIAGVADNRLLYSYDKQGHKTYSYDNYFLQETIATGNGSAAETVARLGVFGGVAQAAIAAGSSTYDAISGRMGVGANGSNITVADNTQGAALWLAPIYKNSDSDSFDAQGVNYGVDMDLYGVALGADYTLNNGLRVGAMFNVGSGDIDGQGAGSGVSNDFDYYGFGAYVGYTMGAMSVVADLSYTVADNDLEGNTAIDKVGASLDSTNLSFGVTGAYQLDVNGFAITPHAGLRYSQIDIDDYTVDGEDIIADYNADSMNIFSIPVGVTFSKEFTGNAWTVKPSFDVTLTGNFGDDETDGTVYWAGVENLSTNVSSEVLDSFTYGATLGVAAQTGNFSLGLGLNYTGSSNTDEFGLQANARFVF